MGRPTQLPACVTREVEKRSHGDFIELLPVNIKHLHLIQKGAADSSKKEAHKLWFESDAGKAWQLARQKLFQADDALSSDGDDA